MADKRFFDINRGGSSENASPIESTKALSNTLESVLSIVLDICAAIYKLVQNVQQDTVQSKACAVGLVPKCNQSDIWKPSLS